MKRYSQVNISPNRRTQLKRGYRPLIFGMAMGLLGAVIFLYNFLPDSAPFELPLFNLVYLSAYTGIWAVFFYGASRGWDKEWNNMDEKSIDSIIAGIAGVLLILGGGILFIYYLFDMSSAYRAILIISPFMVLLGSVLASYYVTGDQNTKTRKSRPLSTFSKNNKKRKKRN